MKKYFAIIFSIFCIMLLAASASAEHAYSTSAQSEDYRIASNEIVIYNLAITNNQNKPDRLFVESTTTGWDITISPYTFEIGALETKNITIRISPPRGVSLGSYTIEFTIRSLDDRSVRTFKFLPVVIDKIVREKGESLFDFSHTLPQRIEQGQEKVNLDLSIKNTIIYPINRLNINFNSELFENPYNLYIQKIEPGETSNFENIVISAKNTSVGSYVVNITIKEGDNIVYEEQHSLFAGSFGVVEETECTGSLIKSCAVSIRNEKISDVDSKFTVEISGLARYVVGARPEPSNIETYDGVKKITWEYYLQPGEAIVFKYVIWYLYYVLALIILAIVSAIGIYNYSLDFKIGKSVIAPAGARSIKVQIAIKNKRKSSRHNVVVEDDIPSPLVLVKEFGTMEPTVIKQEHGKVKIMWKFPELGPGEERLMSYRMRSTVGIVGRLTLPLAIAKCKVRNRTKKFYSNDTHILGKPGVNEESKSE